MTDEDKFLVSLNVVYGKANNKLMTAGAIMDGVLAGKLVYEALGFGNVKPYYDFELAYDTLEQMQADIHVQRVICQSELAKLFCSGQKTATFTMYDASGMKNGKAYLSFHFIVHGAGCFRCGLDIVESGLVPTRPGWDPTVYKKRPSSRCSHAGRLQAK